MSNATKKIKLAIIGNQHVGKTSLILRVSEKKFIDVVTCGVTVDFRQIKDFTVDNQQFNIYFYDVAGLAKNNDLAISFIKDAQGLILAFDLKIAEYYDKEKKYDSESLQEQLQHWFKRIQENAMENVPIFIVGCKLDSIKDTKILETINEIILTEVNKTQQLNIIENNLNKKQKGKKLFFETSAKTGEGVQQVFEMLVRQAAQINKIEGKTLQTQKLKKKEKEPCC